MTSIIMNSRRYCNGEEFGFCSGEDSTGQRGSKNISTNYREDISSEGHCPLKVLRKLQRREHRQKTL